MSDPREIPTAERLLYVRGLIFLARADGTIGPEERQRLDAALSACELSPEDAEKARAALDEPLEVEEIWQELRGSPTRFTLYLDAYSLALADDVVVPEEEEALAELRQQLGLLDYEAKALEQVAQSVHGAEDEPDPEALQRTQKALARVAAVGIPVGAAALSGTVQGLSATALASGLTALGLGSGMVGGVGVCLLLGFVSYRSVKWLVARAQASRARHHEP